MLDPRSRFGVLAASFHESPKSPARCADPTSRTRENPNTVRVRSSRSEEVSTGDRGVRGFVFRSLVHPGLVTPQRLGSLRGTFPKMHRLRPKVAACCREFAVDGGPHRRPGRPTGALGGNGAPQGVGRATVRRPIVNRMNS